MKYIIFAVVAVLPLGLSWFIYICFDTNPRDWAIQATDNATDMPFTIYVKVVDEQGQPLNGVVCDYTINRFNSNWVLIGGSGRRGDNSSGTTSSNVDGNITIAGTGHGLIIEKLTFPGYNRLYDEDQSQLIPTESAGKRAGFELSSHGQKVYEPDPTRPAVFVMVHEGATVATTMPCMGGTYPPQQIGGPRIADVPVWPRVPSIPNIRYERTSTKVPTTFPQ